MLMGFFFLSVAFCSVLFDSFSFFFPVFFFVCLTIGNVARFDGDCRIVGNLIKESGRILMIHQRIPENHE